eukprot:145618-Pleurochrysis_carterae.AAC.3
MSRAARALCASAANALRVLRPARQQPCLPIAAHRLVSHVLASLRASPCLSMTTRPSRSSLERGGLAPARTERL